MAGGPPNIKEDIEMSMAEELVPGKMKEQGSQPLGVSQKQQKLDLKAAGSAVVWNMPATWSKKVCLLRLSRCLHVTVQAEDSYPGKEGLQADRLTVQRSWTLSPPYPPAFMALLCILAGPANPEADMVAEIGLEELNGLEMEVMRRQLHVITGLRAVEDQGATWRHREAVFFAMLLSTCIANLWLWMHQCGLHTVREFLSLRGLWYF
ncbi:fetal and adult testis-expressed transcript protein [Monodon monoceros]|uniref:fetal and adult testis-expressed transcript protein n=1 Tax=Monodon monoceros TaxID=40151 RepID=UPI0010F7D195|nr:fetal and adult testis-expressed transcript protein [Monodon monoceros]